MTKRFLFSITTAVILILSLVHPLSAQGDRQIGNRSPISGQSAQRSTVTPKTPEQIRVEMVALYAEAEATFKYLSGYAIARESVQKIGYADISDVITGITQSRKMIETMPDSYLEIMTNSLRDPKALNRLTNGLRKMREDANFQAAMERSEKWFNSKGARISQGEDASSNVRSSPSAPSFIRPVCHFDNLNNFPSATDVGIAKGFSFLAEIITLLIPTTVEVPILGFKIPSPARIIAAIAWGVVEAIAIGLANARDEGTYCQNLAITISAALTTDGTFNASILLPEAGGGFARFLKEYVAAAIQNAKDRSIAVNCADMRLAEADGFYSMSKWVEAYKKYRAAYQNINASACVP